ncbi:methyltransferase family protein [Kineococcus xinjiangensis]|uniref:Methyltransferase family protein n=1 Tax=Kineococcus xinjiangensis TaxID=512762 RepID=A0A2S6INT5_9ACTN|nr:methyltransferase domain-containing protein [Kineococcus xinjiangensis]PPK95913.1 methyltransferase family protein [Kineococcus xinjiangensis]
MSSTGEYVHGHAPSVLRTYDTRTAENSAAHLLPHLRPGTTLLDVGCGAGSITADLAALVAPGAVVGVDTSAEALDAARAHCARRGVEGVTFTAADATALPFPDDSFDVVHAHQVLQHLPDPVAALREMRRVCRPGGYVAARDADYAAMTWYPAEPALQEWRALYDAVARTRGAEPDAGRRLLSWAREADFRDVTAGASTWCYADPAGRELWGGSWAQRILESGTGRSAVESGLATQADLERISAGWRAWAAAEDGWFTILHGEVLCRP